MAKAAIVSIRTGHVNRTERHIYCGYSGDTIHGDRNMTSDMLEDRIRERAYRLWEQDGRPEGKADDYWTRARHLIEAEVREHGGGDLSIPLYTRTD